MPSKYCVSSLCGAKYTFPATAIPTECPVCGYVLAKAFAQASVPKPPAPMEVSQPRVKTSVQPRRAGATDLTDPQCVYVAANYTSLGSLDIAQTLFGSAVTVMSPEFRAIQRYINELVTTPQAAPREEEDDETEVLDDRTLSIVRANAKLLAADLAAGDFTVTVDRSNVVRAVDAVKTVSTPTPAKKTRKGKK